MQTKQNISFLTLLLMISFASVNAVLFTPALPAIANFFMVSASEAQQTITIFLLGYALGQLMYGPLASRYGRKKTLYIGIFIQILSSIACVLSGYLHDYAVLVIARFFLAIGSGVGLKMTFTLVSENYEPKVASQKIAYLMLSFAITPGLSIALGGVLNQHFGWMSCFYAGLLYGVLLLVLVSRLPAFSETLDVYAFQLSHLKHGYVSSFKNRKVFLGGLLMGSATSVIYVFSALAPFIGMNILGLNSAQYGMANILPAAGLALGSILSVQFVKKYTLQQVMFSGIIVATLGVLFMFVAVGLNTPIIVKLFMPMFFIYIGLSWVLANVAAIAMAHAQDKAHGSAVMNFLNMSTATIAVLVAGLFQVNMSLLLSAFAVIAVLMSLIFSQLVKK